MRARPKTKATEKPAAVAKAKIARLVEPLQTDIDDDTDDRQRFGVQSLGRAFGILEEVARHRESIGLADMSKRVRLHNSTTFHLVKTMVSLGYMMKARTVDSEETRRHLQDAHNRVISIAAVQQQLHASAVIGSIELQPYHTKLCEALAGSMIGDDRKISLNVRGDGGSVTCRDAESLGLITTELVINSLKHAFTDVTKDGQIDVTFDVSGTDWKLSVVDNGTGKPEGVFAQPKAGIVNALTKQLDAKVDTVSGANGTTVSVTHATFSAKKARVARSGDVSALNVAV